MAPKQRLVVIGAVAAGTSAAAKAKRSDPDLEVILLERGAHISYGACGLPYFIAGLIPSADALLNRTPEEFRRRGVDVRTQQDVLQIDVANKNLRVADLVNAQEYLLPYDYLVVATGAVPMHPPLPGLDLPGVFTLRTLADGVALKAALQTKAPKSVVIVGGGYVGLEMAEAFRALDLPVTIVESMPQLMVTLDEDMSKLVLAEVEHNGASVLLNDGLVRCEGSDHIHWQSLWQQEALSSPVAGRAISST